MFCYSMHCPLYCSNFPELKQSKQSSYFRCLWLSLEAFEVRYVLEHYRGHRYQRKKVDFAKNTLQQVLVAGTMYSTKTRQTGQQGIWARSIDVTALTTNIFVVATNITNKARPFSSLPKLKCLWNNFD
jgi:hypothetical protein